MLSIWVGLRYIRSSSKQGFLSLLSWISLLGMTLGVMALIVVMSVMNGFQSELQGRLLNALSHAVIKNADDVPISKEQFLQLSQKLDSTKYIVRADEFLAADAMLAVNNRLRAVQLQGVAVKNQQTVSGIEKHIINGDFNQFNEQPYSIVMGAPLAKMLGLSVGDRVTIMLPKLTITPFSIRPRIKQFKLVATFVVGADVDMQTAFIRLADAKKLLNIKGHHAMHLMTDDAMSVDQNLFTLQQEVSLIDTNFQVVSWKQSKQQLFQAIKMEKWMIGFMLSLVVAVAAFNLIAVLSMMVAQKRLEIAVLRMMGASARTVLMIFLAQGLSLVLLSLLTGGVLGVLLALNISDLVHAIEQMLGVYIFDPNVFYITGLPSQLQWSDVLYIVIFTFLLSVLFSLYPAFRASNIKAIEAMQS